MKIPPLGDNIDTSDGLLSDGQLYFGDGSLKGTAAGIVWIGLMQLHKEGKHDFKHEQVKLLINSLMNIKTILLSSETSNDTTVSCMLRILRQNKASTICYFVNAT